MFWFIKLVVIELLCFSRSLAGIVDTCGHTKCKSLNNQQCMTQHTMLLSICS